MKCDQALSARLFLKLVSEVHTSSMDGMTLSFAILGNIEEAAVGSAMEGDVLAAIAKESEPAGHAAISELVDAKLRSTADASC